MTDVMTEALEPYLRAMLEENTRHNLTAIRDLDQARVLHVLDSLAVRSLDLPATRCCDLGTGNGFPGVALRVVYPDAQVVLLDRTAKKLDAIARAATAAGLERIETRHVDARLLDQTSDLWGAFDLITVRAVGRPRGVAHLARPLAAPGAHLVLWLDRNTEAPGVLPGFEKVREHAYALPEPAARERRLGLYRATAHRPPIRRGQRP